MIFAAGLGTRLENETADKPKALVKAGGKTLLEHAILKVRAAGASRVVINVHHFSEKIIEFIHAHNWGVPVMVSNESGLLLETGGGLKKAALLFSRNEPILLYNVDILCDLDLSKVLEKHLSSNALATLIVRNRNTQRYFKFDDNMQLVGWINKQNGEKKISRPENFDNAKELAFSGIHIVNPDIFEYMPAENRFSIVKLYLELAKTKTIKGLIDNSELWMDVGKPDELEAARRLFRNTE